MTDYEVELGSITERRDARTDRPMGVYVDVHVRRARAERGVGEPQSGDYVVVFDVVDGHARFREVDSETAFDDLALVAVRAAADELAAVADAYEVEPPLETIRHSEYTTHDHLT